MNTELIIFKSSLIFPYQPWKGQGKRGSVYVCVHEREVQGYNLKTQKKSTWMEAQ